MRRAPTWALLLGTVVTVAFANDYDILSDLAGRDLHPLIARGKTTKFWSDYFDDDLWTDEPDELLARDLDFFDEPLWARDAGSDLDEHLWAREEDFDDSLFQSRSVALNVENELGPRGCNPKYAKACARDFIPESDLGARDLSIRDLGSGTQAPTLFIQRRALGRASAKPQAQAPDPFLTRQNSMPAGASKLLTPAVPSAPMMKTKSMSRAGGFRTRFYDELKPHGLA